MVSPANFKIVGNIVYAEPVEYMHISKTEVDALHDVVKNNISGNFGLIETRLRNTSIDPVVYRYARELMPQFTAFALVAESDLTFQLFRFEEADLLPDVVCARVIDKLLLYEYYYGEYKEHE